LHCAPRMHEALGTLSTGGTVRLSPGWATTEEEIVVALEAIAQTASAAN
jgi:selenocysteine lyase/cysteine desulfurase